MAVLVHLHLVTGTNPAARLRFRLLIRVEIAWAQRFSRDNIGVITGQQDADGFADLVLTIKGEKPVFATLLTNEPLEPADRIVDIIELDYDPATGIALYGAFLQY